MPNPRSHLAALLLAPLLATHLVACSSQVSDGTGLSTTPGSADSPAIPPGGSPSDPSGGTASTPDPSWANVQDFGAVGDGVHDDTAAFQAAAATGNTVWVPRPSAFYMVTGTIWLMNSIIGDTSDLANMPMIRMIGADGNGYHITLMVRGYKGPTELLIAGLQIDGGYTSGQTGEFDHLITISGSDNVRVSTCRLLNAKGDAVQIGEWHRAPSNPMLNCNNIKVENTYIYNPFRCAVAPLGAGTGSSVKNSYVNKQNRLDGSTYIPPFDIEPELDSYTWDFRFENIVADLNNLHLVWQVKGQSSTISDYVHGTYIANCKGNMTALLPNGPPWIDGGGNQINVTPPPWTMQPFAG